MRIFESFAGYGSHRLACNRHRIKVESVGISEIDVDAIIAYTSLHCDMEDYVDLGLAIDEKKKILMDCNVGYDFKKEKSSIPRMKKDKLELLFKSHILSHNKGDISLIDPQTLPEMDLLTYSFPCTDISVAGKQEGMKKDSGTSSSLLWECEKIIDSKHPKFLMMENVKALVNKKNIEHFEVWLDVLTNLGYNNYWKIINAKNCGVPQNRERVFCVSILKEFDDGNFKFEDDFDNGIRLKDMLESEVDEKYYIDGEKVRELIKQIKDKENLTNNNSCIPCLTPDRVEKRQEGRRFKENGDPSFTLTSQDRHGVLIIDDTQGFDGIRTYDNESPCLRGQRSGLKILEPNECIKELDIPKEVINDNERQRRVYSINGIPPTVLARKDSNKILQLEKLVSEGELARYMVIAKFEDREIVLQNHSYSSYQLRLGDWSCDCNRASWFDLDLECGDRIKIDIFDENGKIIYTENESNFVGEGHHPFSKSMEFNGFHDKECPTLLATDYKAPKTILEFNRVDDPSILRPERTEYGKQIRKKYENGEIDESRHRMTEMMPRKDGVSNTITTVQKDNLLLEPNEINQVGNISNSDSFNGDPQTGRIYAIDGISPTLNTCGGGQREPKVFNNYRIRKLTPTECFRLMGLSDEEINKIQNTDISNSQQYKMAGNSIVVDCMTFLRNLPKIDFY